MRCGLLGWAGLGCSACCCAAPCQLPAACCLPGGACLAATHPAAYDRQQQLVWLRSLAPAAVSFRGKETADSYILRQARQYSEQGIQKVGGVERMGVVCFATAVLTAPVQRAGHSEGGWRCFEQLCPSRRQREGQLEGALGKVGAAGSPGMHSVEQRWQGRHFATTARRICRCLRCRAERPAYLRGTALQVCIVSDDLEVALLGPDVMPRFPGQAVFSTSCGALIQVSILPFFGNRSAFSGSALLFTTLAIAAATEWMCLLARWL